MLVVMLGGAYYDVTEHRIPNWWTLAAAVCGLCLAFLGAPEGAGAAAAGRYLLRLASVAAVLFPLFVTRMAGAGDIKLMAVMAACLGIRAGFGAIFRGCVLGAVLALVKLLAQRNLRGRLMYLFGYFSRLFRTGEIVPYYVAERDGCGIVVPFAFCLCLGYVWYLAGAVF